MKIMTSLLATAALAVPAMIIAQDSQSHTPLHHHYRLIDLGTFGGPASYVNAPFAQGAFNQINKQGIVVGAAATGVPIPPTPPNRPLCGGVDGKVPSVFHAFKWQKGALADLGALGPDPGVECSEAVSINNKGEIAGRSGFGVADPFAPAFEEFHAVIWKDDQIKDLGTLGGSHSLAIAINNRSQVVGYSFNAIPDPYSLVYFFYSGITTGTQTRAFLWQNGIMRDLGTLGGPDSQALSVNELGQISGTSYVNSIPNAITGIPIEDPFLWTEERGMIDLGTLGGVSGAAGIVNNRSQVLGTSSLASDPGACLGIGNTANCHFFLWDDGKLTDLNTDTIGGSLVTANDLSDAGQVVGRGSFPGRPFDAYLWSNGIATDLGAVADDCYSEAFAINFKSQIVGQSYSCVTNTLRTFIWENGSIADLNTLASPHTLQLVEAFSINNRGEIGGIGTPPGCAADDVCGRGYVLIPCDEDHPNVEGCDYTLVDPSEAAQVRSESLTQSAAPTPGQSNLLSVERSAQFPSLGRAITAGRLRFSFPN